jgi:hypothetical protein
MRFSSWSARKQSKKKLVMITLPQRVRAFSRRLSAATWNSPCLQPARPLIRFLTVRYFL